MINKYYVKRIFEVTKADCGVFEYMMLHYNRELVCTEIADKLNRNITTIQRAVKRLYENNLVERIQENLKGGGYIFKYKLKPFNELEKMFIARVMKNNNDFCSQIKQEFRGMKND